METYERICLRDYSVSDKNGKTATVERGKEYVTSRAVKGRVLVFSTFWFHVPVDVFGGEIEFTKT